MSFRQVNCEKTGNLLGYVGGNSNTENEEDYRISLTTYFFSNKPISNPQLKGKIPITDFVLNFITNRCSQRIGPIVMRMVRTEVGG